MFNIGFSENQGKHLIISNLIVYIYKYITFLLEVVGFEENLNGKCLVIIL